MVPRQFEPVPTDSNSPLDAVLRRLDEAAREAAVDFADG